MYLYEGRILTLVKIILSREGMKENGGGDEANQDTL
jgi:hypothetical protein